MGGNEFGQPDNKFLLTRLMRGVTVAENVTDHIEKFLLTRLMRGVTSSFKLMPLVPVISTHTPHARRDCCAAANVQN